MPFVFAPTLPRLFPLITVTRAYIMQNSQRHSFNSKHEVILCQQADSSLALLHHSSRFVRHRNVSIPRDHAHIWCITLFIPRRQSSLNCVCIPSTMEFQVAKVIRMIFSSEPSLFFYADIFNYEYRILHECHLVQHKIWTPRRLE